MAESEGARQNGKERFSGVYAGIALITLALSAGQALVAWVQKEKELASIKAEKDRELTLAEEKSKSELSRIERESAQAFDMRIYDAVTSAVEKKNEDQQELARVLVESVAREPLRTSMLEVLRKRGVEAVSAKANATIKEERRFASEQEQLNRIAPGASWTYDVFWCEASGEEARAKANAVRDRLAAVNPSAAVRVRKLPESVNRRQGFGASGYLVHVNRGEDAAVEELQKKLADLEVPFRTVRSYVDTPRYLSFFLCP